MRIEIPVVKRCCCCLPLRRGLIFWIYLKMAVALFLLFFFTDALIRLIRQPPEIIFFFVVAITLFMALLDIAFCVLFLISAHRKNHDYMRIYYRYAIGILILEVLVMLGFAGFEIFEIHSLVRAEFHVTFILNYVLESFCFIFAQITLQTYLVILVRSEVLKLEDGIKFEFTNHTSDPECKAEILL